MISAIYNFALTTGANRVIRGARIEHVCGDPSLGAEKDYGIRLYGVPSGYEFGTLIDAILDVSHADSGLGDETRAALQALERPVHIQVFSTPT